VGNPKECTWTDICLYVSNIPERIARLAREIRVTRNLAKDGNSLFGALQISVDLKLMFKAQKE